MSIVTGEWSEVYNFNVDEIIVDPEDPTVPTEPTIPAIEYKETNKLISDDPLYSISFGYSVSISGDGTRCVIGAVLDRPDKVYSTGSAYVFIRSGTNWIQEAKLTASDKASGDRFGSSVAITSDGTRCIIGASDSDSDGIANAGAVYSFIRLGTNWIQESKITPTDKRAGGNFGQAVAVSSDGTRCIVGTDSVEAAYVFTRSGSSWSEEAKLVTTTGTGIDFGCSVSITNDGSRCIIGAKKEGYSYIFARSGTNWIQEARFTVMVAGYPVTTFGYSVSISGDGTRCVVGATDSDRVGTYVYGAAYIFARSGTNWIQEAKLSVKSGIDFDKFGVSVSLSEDGSLCCIGADSLEHDGINNAGAAFVFRRVNTSWTQVAKLLAADKTDNDYFGRSVAITRDGTRCIIGAINAGYNENSNAGAAYIFS